VTRKAAAWQAASAALRRCCNNLVAASTAAGALAANSWRRSCSSPRIFAACYTRNRRRWRCRRARCASPVAGAALRAQATRTTALVAQ
jgi:hypothetical protein